MTPRLLRKCLNHLSWKAYLRERITPKEPGIEGYLVKLLLDCDKYTLAREEITPYNKTKYQQLPCSENGFLIRFPVKELHCEQIELMAAKSEYEEYPSSNFVYKLLISGFSKRRQFRVNPNWQLTGIISIYEFPPMCLNEKSI